ncbi:vacuolar protein sorting-associated protein 45-like protein [Gossypium australe]|uniref:Vacuolar protein sorting-associated protein 45-like protein n=1 Tax=Gossypium australe TaxID=47621 RepID=A0A5B6TZB3_9ROSI|nr:vacuolar protein sorting-associated protein 45-like protein [Gossypium australe]
MNTNMILRARMELESVSEEARSKHQATSLLESHRIARSDDMENILSFAQGYGPRRLTNAQVFAELQRASRQIPHDGGVVRDESTEMVPDFETKSKEKGEKETERLESSLRELFKVEKSSNQTSGNKKDDKLHDFILSNMYPFLATQQYINEMLRLAGPGMKMILMDKETV